MDNLTEAELRLILGALYEVRRPWVDRTYDGRVVGVELELAHQVVATHTSAIEKVSRLLTSKAA
jgi:hypothetical protein